MPMTPPSDPKPAAPFEVVLTKQEDGTWSGVIELPPHAAQGHAVLGASRLTGDEAELEAKGAMLQVLGRSARSGVPLPSEVEALFCRRIA